MGYIRNVLWFFQRSYSIYCMMAGHISDGRIGSGA